MKITTRRWICGALVQCLVICSLPRTGTGAMIQPGTSGSDAVVSQLADQMGEGISPEQWESARLKLEQAGLSREQAAKIADSLDRAEYAQLEKTDLTQIGGNGLGTVLVVLLIVAIAIWIAKNI